MRNVSMLVQAEKCAFLLHDRERGELVARPPAVGFRASNSECFASVKTKASQQRRFTAAKPLSWAIAPNSPLDQAWTRRIDVRNFIVYPLVLERRDDTERLVERATVGVF
jgi:two-component system phosphate regulon sensor histidine kinase PhoR